VIKKQFAIALSIIIFGLPVGTMAQARASVENMRANVQVLSASKDTQVEVKFHDKTKVKGYIVAVEPVSFTVKDPKDGRLQSITYSEVDSVNKASSGISTKTWLIVAGVAAGAVTTWLVVKPAVCDGGAQTRGVC
jgi:hypothetical protein